ncbi:hypothetical protein [Jannaschia rubra]|uniref:Uncharacterized protein n=1 Tax=Jannaschia rubra TaxID=282197 RepID=A0A0M6XTB3_9RHOB|nr:hypothetical protein [Jannaschia rubra]CTQ34399.1 hypothetical protein JAN5088_03195 [Jannaschia rubra]SFG62230.1 hypothetical protein SAMN04488517_10836 [Jannaschia rubra]
MDTMIELPAMRRSAELAPNSADADARTVEVVWSAGARVRRATFFGEPYDEELSLDPSHVRLDRMNAGAPFLKVHELDTLDAVIGSVVPGSARIENGRGIALMRISERADLARHSGRPHPGGLNRLSVHRFEVSKPYGQ